MRIAWCVSSAPSTHRAASSRDEYLGLRVENAALKRKIAEQDIELQALKRARKQAAEDVTKILAALQAE